MPYLARSIPRVMTARIRHRRKTWWRRLCTVHVYRWLWKTRV